MGSNNPYLDTLEQDASSAAGANQTDNAANPYLEDTLQREQQQRDAQLRANLTLNAKGSPDAAADPADTAAVLGVNPMAAQALPSLGQAAKVKAIDDVTQQAPVTRAAMADPQFAQLAHDDVPNLVAHEQLAQQATTTPRGLWADIGTAIAGSVTDGRRVYRGERRS